MINLQLGQLFLPSVKFRSSNMSNSLWPHGLQHARLPCPLPTPGIYSKSCPLSQWCHPTISSSVIPFSFCLQSFPASVPMSFAVSQFFASGGQSIGVSASASVLPVTIQGWFPLGWTDWISLQSKGLSRVFSNSTVLPSGTLSFMRIINIRYPVFSSPNNSRLGNSFSGNCFTPNFNK